MNLFKENKIRKTINVALFTDERKNIDGWNYISTIIIPTNKFSAFHNKLIEHRKSKNYFNALKFSEIKKKGIKQELSELWLNEVLEDDEYKIYFSVLGLNTRLLNENKFGTGDLKKGKNYANLYNRFFRTTILSVKYFFSSYDKIIIDRVFHDTEGNLKNHKYFDWHSIYKISKEEKITFRTEKITFINSDQKKELKHPKVSQFIQLSDILVGTISHCLDFERKRHTGKNELGRLFYPLLYRILKSPKNKNSKYKYYKKYDINFFPSEVPEDLKSFRQYIHKNKSIKIHTLIRQEQNKKIGQQELKF